MLEELFEKSRNFFLAADLVRSKEILDEVKNQLNSLPENQAKAILQTRYHNNLASIYQRMLDYPTARKHYLKALEMINSMPHPRPDHLAMVYNNLGMLETNTGNLDQAEEFLRQSEERISEIKDRRKKDDQQRSTSFNRARLLMKQQRLDDAREEVARMNRLIKGKISEDGEYEARNFETSGHLLAALAKESESSQSPEYLEFQNWSITHFHHAQELYEKLKDPYRAMRASLNAVAVDLDAGRNSKELLECLEEVEGYAEEIASPALSGLVIERRVQYFVNAENSQLALTETERCLDLLHEIPVPERLRILGRLKGHAVAMEQKPLEKRLDKYIQTLAGGEGAEQRIRG
jgi:tetratricopeptide (TPR) repeat protein